jgi:hypothetical protein
MDSPLNRTSLLISDISPYFFCLYYLEVIYLTMLTALIAGRAAAVITGLTLAALLTVHLIQLHSRRDIHRKIQLALMDIHSAFSFAFVVNTIFSGAQTGTLDILIVSVRVLLMTGGIASITALSSTRVKENYS